MAGVTNSNALPATPDAIQGAYGGFGDAMLARLDPTGSILYATYLGGSANDSASAVALDPGGNIYVAGGTSSSDFPTSAGAYQRVLQTNCPYPTGYSASMFIGIIPTYATGNVFVTKLGPSAHSILYPTYLGGNCLDTATGIAVDPGSNVWVSGFSDSSTFPQVWPVDTPPPYSQGKAFVTRIADSGAWLWRSSFLSVGNAVATDALGNAYAGGAGTLLLKVGPH